MNSNWDKSKQMCDIGIQPIQNLVYKAVIKLKDNSDSIIITAETISKIYYYLEHISANIIEEVTIRRVDEVKCK